MTNYVMNFRNDSNQLLTRGLFWETSYNPSAIYTTGRQDREITLEDGSSKTLVALYPHYIAMCDITEYDFASKFFESWEHWKSVSESPLLKDLVAKWREEVEIKIVSEALKLIQAEALSSSKYAYAANRYLADRGWKPKEDKPKKRVGRPTKTSIQEQEAQRLDPYDVLETAKRLGIN